MQRRQSGRIAQKRAEAPEPTQPAKKSKVNAAPKQVHAEANAAGKTLLVGDALPRLALLDQYGDPVDVQDLANAVIFTYPKASTPGCTKQACCYRDAYDEWEKDGYAVFGLSSDAPKAQHTFATKQSLPYRLLSDPDRMLIGALTGTKSKTVRSHFVVRNKKLARSSVGVKPVECSRAALQFAKS